MTPMAVAVGGAVLAVLGWLAAMVAPKVPPDNADEPGAWITPDDYSVQPWTAVVFGAGVVLALTGLAEDWQVFVLIWAGILGLTLWILLIRWLTRQKTGAH